MPWNVTYEVITPESAEDGEAADRGFAAEGVTLREALSAIGYHPHPHRDRPAGLEDSGSWFSTSDPDRDYQDGSEKFYAIHPPRGITSSSYARARRVLVGARR